MHTFAKKAAAVVSTALLLGVGLPLVPGMAGSAYACAGVDAGAKTSDDPKQATHAPAKSGSDKGGSAAGAPVRAASTTVTSDWSKVSMQLSGVPTRVSRERLVHARLTVVNGSGTQKGRIPVVVYFSVDGKSSLDPNPPKGSTDKYAAKPADVSVSYSYANVTSKLSLRRECQGLLGGRFALDGRGAPGTRTTIDLAFTIKSSLPANAVDSYLSASIDVSGRQPRTESAYFDVRNNESPSTKPTTKPSTKPSTEPTATPSAKTSVEPTGATAGTSRAQAADRTELAKTGGSMVAPLASAGAVLVLVGGAGLAVTRRRRVRSRTGVTTN